MDNNGWDDDERPQCNKCGNIFNPEMSGYADTSKCGRCWDKINMDDDPDPTFDADRDMRLMHQDD